MNWNPNNNEMYNIIMRCIKYGVDNNIIIYYTHFNLLLYTPNEMRDVFFH